MPGETLPDFPARANGEAGSQGYGAICDAPADAPAAKPELLKLKNERFFLMNSLYNTLVSLLGGGLSGWIIASHQKRLDRRDEEERQKNADQIAELQEKRLSSLEKIVENHIANDNPEATKLQLNLILGALNKTGDKVDRLAEGLAEARTEVRESKNFTQNLYTSMKEIRDRKNGN